MELTLTGASLVSNNAGDGGVISSASAASATTTTTTRRSIMNGEHAKTANANPGVRSAATLPMPLPSSTGDRATANGDHGHSHSHSNGHPHSQSCQHGSGHGHSHSHDHGHCQHHQHQHGNRLLVGGGAGAGGGMARMPMAMPPRPDVKTKEGRAEALLSAVKFGSFEQFRRAVDLVPETSRMDELDGYLSDGHTLAHWATKRCPDVRFLRLLADLPGGAGGGVDLHRQSRDEVGMYPIHWAATEEDSIGVASFLLARIGDRDADAADDVKPSTYNGMMTVAGVGMGMGSSMTEGMPAPPSTLFDGGTEGTPRRQRSSLLPRLGPLHARDKSGCTPLLVAAQYGRANLAAFLIKRGADPSALDHSRDSALHWAAYKGNVAVAGLLLHLAGDSGGGGDHDGGNSLPLDAPDKYGQTPLHLAALRGNSDVLEYFLEEAEHAYASSASHSAIRQPPPSPVRRSNHGGRIRGGGGGLRRLFGGRSAAAYEGVEDNDLDLRLTSSTPASSSQSLQSTTSSSSTSTPSPGSLLQMTDDQGRTPLDLSSKYNRKGCELVLREWIDRYHVHERAGGRNLGDRVVRCAVHLRGGARQLFSVDSWRAWMGLGLGGESGRHGEGDADLGHLQRQVKWPLVLVLLCMTVSAAMYPLRFVRGDMVLTGGKSAFWHMFTLTSMAVMWVTFVLTWRTNPGCIQTLDKAAGSSRISTAGSRRRMLSGSGVGGGSGGDDIDVELHRIATELRGKYDEALERYAEDRSSSAGSADDSSDANSPPTSSEPVPPLCHTCRIVRPLRSKHCRVQRRCVLVFDHYCPFVGNTVGLYNYRYFYGFLVSLVTSEIGFITTWVKYLAAAPGWDLFALSAGLLCGVFVVPGIGMAWYHTILVGRNLTTNEHQNMWRYGYLRDGRTGSYRNPFDAGILNNAHGRMFPDERQYTLPPSSAAAAGGGGTAAGAEGTTDALSGGGGGGGIANGVTGGIQGDEEKEELLSRMV